MAVIISSSTSVYAGLSAVRRAQTELGTFFSILYLSPSKERRSVELWDLLYFIKRFRQEIPVYFPTKRFFALASYSIETN